MIGEVLIACALIIASYLAGAAMTRRSIARIYDQRPHCTECGLRSDRPIVVWRCPCGGEAFGPHVADDIRDDAFFDTACEE